MIERSAPVVCLMIVAACSSSSSPAGTPDASVRDAPPADAAASPDAVPPDAPAAAGNCTPNPALASHRDACEFGAGALATETIGDCPGASIPIEHIIVLMQENRSFDQYYGHLPGHGQDDVDVAPIDTSNPDPDGGVALPWHHETAYCVQDTDHGWSASHEQWNDGAMDGFARSNVTAEDPNGHRAMGFYEEADLPFYYKLISTFATSDRYFCSLLGPTFPNRMYLVAATSFGIVTTDVNVLAPAGVPQLYSALDAAGVTWKAYSASLSSAFLFPDYAVGHAAHLVGVDQFATDAAAGTLPQVAFIEASFEGKADSETDEHPPADIQLGQEFVSRHVQTLIHSPQWSSSALFITYDEHGGLYDHVPPPAACAPDDTAPRLNPELGGFDRLGFRVPVIVVSPYARRNFVSHEVHSHTSILRFIETKFGLPALTARDANSDAMLDLFDFASPPQLDVPELPTPVVDDAALQACRLAFP